jgi:hypothetical protein
MLKESRPLRHISVLLPSLPHHQGTVPLVVPSLINSDRRTPQDSDGQFFKEFPSFLFSLLTRCQVVGCNGGGKGQLIHEVKTRCCITNREILNHPVNITESFPIILRVV